MAHMSGSMGHYSGYGTIKIHLQSSEGLGVGEEYKYKTANSPTEHTATVAYMNGKTVLVDNNYTLGTDPPPFYIGQTLTVLVPNFGYPLLTTTITDITPLNELPPCLLYTSPSPRDPH